MTQGRQRLELCPRETLVAIRRQQTDIAALTALAPRTAEEELAIADQLRRSRSPPAEIRRLWPVRLAMAMQALDGMQGTGIQVPMVPLRAGIIQQGGFSATEIRLS